MKAEIISIGDELLIGQVINTNASWMGTELNSIGVEVRQITVVSDTDQEIERAITEAISHVDIVLLTGGLGPTKDDITKKTLTRMFDAKLFFHQDIYEHIQILFRVKGLPVNELNRAQAELPDICEIVPNEIGTASGMLFRKDKKVIISMPGVPFEMKHMMKHHILPLLKKEFQLPFILHRTIMTTGMGESELAKVIESWEDALPENIRLAYLPRPGIVRLRLTAYGENKEQLEDVVAHEILKLNEIIPDLIFGYDDIPLEEVLGSLLKQKSKTVATAESCTGGYISHLLTSIPGSSEYFIGSVVAYAYDAKEELLGVKHDSLVQHGAVSEIVAKEMAEGVRERLKTDYAIAVTGIAGPGGGLPNKPVGTIWFAIASEQQTKAIMLRFGNDRMRNIRRGTIAALNMLRLELLNL
jgi:nicotinamide-nucleotide amidase